jgi:7-cyano-7-deazaguanine synthase
MCSILGGTTFNQYAVEVFNRAKDRGRDYTGLAQYGDYWIANHRATPTNETDAPIENQPFGKDFKVVHNGTIANDEELGNNNGGIDSKVLADVIDPTNVFSVRDSLERVRGSYAIAILKKDDIILACNYKPIWYIERDGEYFFSSLQWHLGNGATRVPPYSVLSLTSGISCEIKRYQPNRALIVASGGLDSTALTGFAKSNHDEIRLLHFNYGCKATEREIAAIKNIAAALACDYEVVDLDYTKFKGNSTLFKEDMITSGVGGVEYALDWVYARNLILLSIAVGYAEANGFGYIYIGTNLEEGGAYPDNEEQFILDFNTLLYGAVNNGYKVEIRTPLGGLMKKEIVEYGTKWGSPLENSWSCYNNLESHCGECGPCYMRKRAFKRANIPDPTKYLK